MFQAVNEGAKPKVDLIITKHFNVLSVENSFTRKRVIGIFDFIDYFFSFPGLEGKPILLCANLSKNNRLSSVAYTYLFKNSGLPVAHQTVL
jgi:hypothetical protein